RPPRHRPTTGPPRRAPPPPPAAPPRPSPATPRCRGRAGRRPSGSACRSAGRARAGARARAPRRWPAGVPRARAPPAARGDAGRRRPPRVAPDVPGGGAPCRAPRSARPRRAGPSSAQRTHQVGDLSSRGTDQEGPPRPGAAGGPGAGGPQDRMSTRETLTLGADRFRVGPWHADAAIAYLTLPAEMPKPSAAGLHRCLERLRDEGYTSTITAALHPEEAEAFLQAGFVE